MTKKDLNQNIGIAVEQINIDGANIDNAPDTEGLSIIPTRNLVLFPGVTISISVRREISERVANAAVEKHVPVGIVCQRDPENDTPSLTTGLYRHGVLADVLKVIELPDGEKTILVHARNPIRIDGAGKRTGHVSGLLSARITVFQEEAPDSNDKEFNTIIGNIRKKVSSIAPSLNEPMTHMFTSMLQCDDPMLLINMLLTHLPAATDEKVNLLKVRDMKARALGLLRMLHLKEQEMNITLDIMRQVKADMDEEQRRAFLHQEMVNIQEQLYGDSADEIRELEERGNLTAFPPETRNTFNKELSKIRRINPQNPDYSVLYTYLDTLLEMPWDREDSLNTDFASAREALEQEHSGLEKVKERILEQLAVIMHNPGGKAPILCLVGPPGVGKTSLGQSVATALGRKYRRVSLGGLHDESEIRGHRRTYIGAMPGRIVEAMRKAGTVNPVLVLDEIDKIGNDYKGDPEAALLEVLDPEQNCHFHDNYLDVDYDLSKVLFIATANSLSTVARPLLDRMEIIEIPGYLPEEKLEIARKHLLRRIEAELKLPEGTISITDEALNDIIDLYTSESGVRQLEKKLAAIGRKLVMAIMSGDEVPESITPDMLTDLLGIPPFNKSRCEDNSMAGVVTGLAWTQAGGEILLVESSLTHGKGEKLTLTGNLGDVMKESATIALQWVKAHASLLGIDPALFDKYNVHLHFPEGAIPKDGPSAGITIATSLVSLFTQRRVRERLAMTGEITLRGRVLPVGGIKEKILAAKRAGVTDIILSADNRKDIDDIDRRYVEGLTFHFVDTVLDVMRIAVTDTPVAQPIVL